MHNVHNNRARSGPEDGDAFVNASKELQDWMESEEEQKGKQLFRKIGIDLISYYFATYTRTYTRTYTYVCMYVCMHVTVNRT